jgi:hypothetical protein
VEEFVFSGTNWTRLTQNLLGLFRDRRIKMFSHTQLIKELLSVKVVEKSYGYRLDHDSGHFDDCVVALGMAALAAMSHQPRRAGSYRSRRVKAQTGKKNMCPGAMPGTIKVRDHQTGTTTTLRR